MSKVLHRRPSPSMVVAIIALVVAMSGSAVAATKLITGDKLIKKGSLSGNRLRRHTLTGTQINVKKLGTVPSAAKANLATSATNAINAANATNAVSATNAVNATNATNAAELGGAPPSSYLSSSSRVGTAGLVVIEGNGAGNVGTLFKDGPFTVTLTCTTSGAGTAATVHASSTQANSDLDGAIVSAANTSTDLGSGPDVPASTSFSASNDETLDFEAPSGSEAVVSGTVGVNWPATGDCFANLPGIA